MEVTIRGARPDEVPAIMEVMREAQRAMHTPDWFLPDDDAYMAAHIDGPNGFCLVAERPDGSLAAYFTVKLAGTAPDALGRYLGMDEAALSVTAQMDSCCVRPACQGHSLQGALLAAAEARLKAEGRYKTLLATVHPENAASLNTLLHRGYEIAAPAVQCYGDKIRHVMRKEW